MRDKSYIMQEKEEFGVSKNNSIVAGAVVVALMALVVGGVVWILSDDHDNTPGSP